MPLQRRRFAKAAAAGRKPAQLPGGNSETRREKPES